MDKLETAADAVQKFSEIQFTTILLFALLFGGFVVIAFVFVRYSISQASATRSNGEILGKQLELQGKQLDAFNGLNNQMGRLEAAVSLQNVRFTEYNNNVVTYLTKLTDAMGTSLEILGRVEKNGKIMADGIGETRKEVKVAVEQTEAAKSGIHQLTEIVAAGLTDINNKLEIVTTSLNNLNTQHGILAESAKDLPQIREQLNDARQQLEKLTRDVQQLDIPRTDTLPNSNEGKENS